ncbi:MAG: DUF2947 domain-containing protein [Clostridiales bacterium]|nr:DUF2947 domain-containing protein [Clostridiales bacterium]
MQKYIPLYINGSNWIFRNPVVDENDLKNIRPFSKEYASKYWSDNIYSEHHLQIGAGNLYSLYYAPNSKKENLQIGSSNNWICTLQEAEYNWMNDWNDDNIQGLPGFLSSCVDLPEDELIIFFWSKSRGLETTWGVFLRNWINFLYDDESPILICLRTGYSIRFGQTGTLYLGYKNKCQKI